MVQLRLQYELYNIYVLYRGMTAGNGTVVYESSWTPEYIKGNKEESDTWKVYEMKHGPGAGCVIRPCYRMLVKIKRMYTWSSNFSPRAGRYGASDFCRTTLSTCSAL